MKNLLKKLKTILLISVISLLCFAGLSYAVNNSSTLKIGNTTYSPAMAVGGNPPVSCNVIASGSDGTSLLISFISGKKAGKTAFANLNFNLSSDEYNNLMVGDTINFQQGSDFTSLIGQKIIFIFSEGKVKKSRTKITSISEGPPSTAGSNYSVMGSVKILDKRADGCLDISFNATAQNPSLNKITTVINPRSNCIESTNSQQLRTIPSVDISGSLYPEKTSGNNNNSSGSSIMLCNAPLSSSGSSIPDFGSSSGFTIPDFGSSSGFTIPDFGNSSGFTIPDFSDIPSDGDSSGTP